MIASFSRLYQIIIGALAAVLLSAGIGLATDGQSSASLKPIRVEYYYEKGCAACDRMDLEILPQLRSFYGGAYTLDSFDTNIESNYLRLVACQEQMGIEINEPIYLTLNGRHLLSGLVEIRNRLYPLMDELLGEQAAAPQAASPAAVAPAATPANAENLLKQRFSRFTPAGIMLAGLLDGINPCAISSLVLFVSLLLVLRVRGRILLLAGILFCAASFLTYVAIGFGLLHVLYRCAGWMPFRHAANLILAGALLILAALSFRDAFRYRASGNPKDVQLRLPRAISLRIQQIMNRGLKSRHILPGAFGIGLLVTALESVCTGQVYVPTLVWIIRHGQTPSRALTYLLAYNAMFILPLVVVFVLAWRGLSTARLLAWSRRNVVVSKCLLGLFFLGLALLFLQDFP